MFPDRHDEKIEKIAHYIVSHTEPWQLGVTKLFKIMWHADVLHYRRYGKTISGQKSYIRMDNGPIPNGIYDALDSLKSSGKIAERPAPTPVGYRREFFDLERAEASWFSAEEIETLHEAITFITPLSAAEASRRTHGPIWDDMLNNQQMPIRAAAIIPSDVFPEDIEWALENKEAFND